MLKIRALQMKAVLKIASSCQQLAFKPTAATKDVFGTLTNLLRSPRSKHVAISKEEGSFPYLAFIRVASSNWINQLGLKGEVL